MRVRKTVLSEEGQKWLSIHSDKFNQIDLSKRLGVSIKTIATYQRELGLKEKRKENSKSKKSAEKPNHFQSGDGYCLDCINYSIGGLCRRNGKMIGALHMKECFKAK